MSSAAAAAAPVEVGRQPGSARQEGAGAGAGYWDSLSAASAARGQQQAADDMGIDTRRVKLFCFMLCSLLAGFAGMITTFRLRSALPSLGEGLELQAIAAAGQPWLVAVRGTRVAGYAYAGPYRMRPAYRFTTEDSIYLAPDALGEGLGRRLLEALIDACTARGDRQMIAVIGDSANAPSIAVHARTGFEHVGVLRAAGRKFDRWIDVVLMQRALGAGSRTPPQERR